MIISDKMELYVYTLDRCEQRLCTELLKWSCVSTRTVVVESCSWIDVSRGSALSSYDQDCGPSRKPNKIVNEIPSKRVISS